MKKKTKNTDALFFNFKHQINWSTWIYITIHFNFFQIERISQDFSGQCVYYTIIEDTRIHHFVPLLGP